MGFISIDPRNIDSQADMARAVRMAIESTFDAEDTRIFADDDNESNDDEKAVLLDARSFRVSDAAGNGTWRITVTAAEHEDAPILVTNDGRAGLRTLMDAMCKLKLTPAQAIYRMCSDTQGLDDGMTLDGARRELEKFIKSSNRPAPADDGPEDDEPDGYAHCAHCADAIMPDDTKARQGLCGQCINMPRVTTDDQAALIELARRIGKES